MSGDNNISFESLGCVYNIQRGLSRGQAVPLIGFVLVSPFKLLLSAVEFVAGTVFALIAGMFGAMTKSEFLLNFAFTAGMHAGLGFGAGLYSIGNMISLGLLGLVLECANCIGLKARW